MELDNFNELNELIINALDVYDNNILKYEKYIIQDVHINYDTYEIKFYNNNNNNIYENNFEILGLFDNTNNIWIWGWVIYINNDAIKISKEILNYGLKIDPEPFPSIKSSFIKSLLVNSRILIETDIELTNNLAIIYYLIRNKCSFIFPHIYYLDDINFITYYFIVK